jgi:chromosome transmission fidelity protein 1
VVLGKKLQACPYYGARRAVKYAQLVVLPYQMLMQKAIRESLGIRLQGNVVIADEAHNITEAINEMYSTELTLEQIEASLAQLKAYRDRFLSALSAKNLVFVKQLVNLLEGLRDSFAVSGAPTIMTTNEFVFHAKVDSFNLFELVRFCGQSKIAFKVNGYSETQAKRQALIQRQQNAKEDVDEITHRRPPVLQLVSFLEALNNPDSDGRVLINQ